MRHSSINLKRCLHLAAGHIAGFAIYICPRQIVSEKLIQEEFSHTNYEHIHSRTSGCSSRFSVGNLHRDVYCRVSSLSTFVHVVNHALVVLEQLRTLLFVCRGDQITVHVKRYWFQVHILYEFKTFEPLLFSYS